MLTANPAPSVALRQEYPTVWTSVILVSTLGATGIGSDSLLSAASEIPGARFTSSRVGSGMLDHSLTLASPVHSGGSASEVLASAPSDGCAHGWLLIRAPSVKGPITQITEDVAIPPELVPRLIAAHSDLMPLIREAATVLSSIFGSRARFSLEPEIDLDGDATSSVGFLLVVDVESSWRDAQSMLDAFDEEWWLDNLDRADGLLSVIMRHG